MGVVGNGFFKHQADLSNQLTLHDFSPDAVAIIKKIEKCINWDK